MDDLLRRIAVAATPGGVEIQEEQGQRTLEAGELLPIEITSGENSWVVYGLMGIDILDVYDDLFWRVRLPEGWRIDAGAHTNYSYLLDAGGKQRGSIYYKAAFYDRVAEFTETKG